LAQLQFPSLRQGGRSVPRSRNPALARPDTGAPAIRPLAGRATDYIFFESNTAGVHQNHIIAHEIGHILLGHQTLEVADVTLSDVEALLVSLNSTVEPGQPASLMRDLLRMRSPAREEVAEELATAIQRELIRRAGLQAVTAEPTRAPLWREYALGLGLSD